jgi:hypothetical protein
MVIVIEAGLGLLAVSRLMDFPKDGGHGGGAFSPIAAEYFNR